MDCWKGACKKHTGCEVTSLYCTGHNDKLGNKGFLDGHCIMEVTPSKPPFDFGIYLPALQSDIVGSTNFPVKLGYCFWWGLRNLRYEHGLTDSHPMHAEICIISTWHLQCQKLFCSSLGQNLYTSAHEWEICFSICISILGLILFSLFIGNMQVYSLPLHVDAILWAYSIANSPYLTISIQPVFRVATCLEWLSRYADEMAHT